MYFGVGKTFFKMTPKVDPQKEKYKPLDLTREN